MAFNETVMFWKPEPGDDLALEPCPFCGGHNVVYEKYHHDAGDRWRVVCLGCCASVDPGYVQQRHVVQKLWNRRAEPVRHGGWEHIHEGVYHKVRCTACGVDAIIANTYVYDTRGLLVKWAYCPNCGAKMDGGNNAPAER